MHQSALDPAARDGVYLGYEHHSSPIPSLVAHLLEVAGAISFLQSSRAASTVRPFRCPVWRFLGKVS
jgi:hypothetical protein